MPSASIVAPLLGDLGADSVDVEVDVHTVDHRFVVAVLHDQILIEESDGPVVGGGRETDEEGVEVEQHLAPDVVDGPVALVDDDEIEVLGWNGRVVFDVGRLVVPRRRRIEGGILFVPAVVLGISLQHRVQALDRRDDDLGGRVDRIGREPLDGVQLRKLAGIVRWIEIGELVPGLTAQVVAVHQEQDAPGAAVLQQAVDGVDRREGLSGARRHLNQPALITSTERLLQVAQRTPLDGPQARIVERRERPQPSAHLFRQRRPFRQRLRPGEVEDVTAARCRVEPVGESRARTVRLEHEGQRAVVSGQIVRQTHRVLPGLLLHAGERASGLCLDGPDGHAIDVEHVVAT